MGAADANVLRALEAFQRAFIFASAIDVRSEDNKGQAGPAWLADERSCTVHVLGGAANLVFTVSSLGTPRRGTIKGGNAENYVQVIENNRCPDAEHSQGQAYLVVGTNPEGFEPVSDTVTASPLCRAYSSRLCSSQQQQRGVKSR